MPPKRRRGEAEPEADDSSGDEYGRAKKSARRTATRSKGRKGGNFSKVPIDVLYEIFRCLHPKDLLRLSWCNKFLRAVLTSKSSRFVWTAALSAIEKLPPCPQDLTEIAYSNLLFHPYCFNCAKPRPVVNWILYRRLCKKCIQKVGVPLQSAWDEICNAGCPLLFVSRENLYSILPWDDDSHDFIQEDIDRLVRDLLAAKPGDYESVKSRHREASAAREPFLARMKEWEYLEKFHQENARKDVRSARVDQMIARLRETEWSDEVTRQTGRQWAEEIPGANVARPLTNKEWTKLLPSTNSYMGRLRYNRISRELQAKRIARGKEIDGMLAEYRGASGSSCPLPSAGDIRALPGVRDTLLDGTDEEFAAIISDTASRLPQLTVQCYEERRTTLMELLPEGLQTRDALFLASFSFSCGLCDNRGMGAREAIHHTCGFTWEPDTSVALDPKENSWSKTLGGLSYRDPDFELRKKIILAAGEDPATVTDAGMDLGNHRFLTYSQSGGSTCALNILSWRGLVSRLNYTPSTLWRPLRRDEMSDFVVRLPPPETDDWSCLHCWKSGPSVFHNRPLEVVKTHILECHHVLEAQPGVDYGYEDTELLHEALRPRLEKEDWSNV